MASDTTTPERMSADWQPTAANVNALPDSLRRYIHALETDCDPAGTIRSAVILRDHIVPELEAKVSALTSELEAARGAALEKMLVDAFLAGNNIDGLTDTDTAEAYASRIIEQMKEQKP